MLTAKEAAMSVPTGLEIVSCKDYGDYFLFTAYKNEYEADPFYLVEKETGTVHPFSIAGNTQMFYSSPEVDWR